MNKLTSYIVSFFSFELLLVLFLNAGRYKGDPRFAWIPVDLTVLFLVLSVVVGIYIVIYKDLSFLYEAIKLNFIYFIFIGYVFLSFFWTPGEIYATEKANYIATLVFWPLLATSIIISSSLNRVKRFLFMVLIFASWFAVETFIVYQQSGGRMVSADLGGNYLGIGRVLGPAALILLGYLLYNIRSITLKIGSMVFIGLILYLLFVVGGRGPLLATIIPIGIPLLASIEFESATVVWVRKSFFFLMSIVILTIISMVYLMNQENAPETLRRLELLLETNDGIGGSAQARLSYYITSIELWIEQPIFGYGVGSWPVLVEHTDVRGYPHNIILETLFEFGMVGMIIMASMFVYAFRSLGSWLMIRTSPYRLIVLMIFANALLNAFVSGDIPDNRFLFATLGLMMFEEAPTEVEEKNKAVEYYS